MPKHLSPTEYVVNGDCSPKCSINEVNLGPEKAKTIHGWYEAGMNDFAMEAQAAGLGFKVGHGSLGRHRRLHLTVKSSMMENEELGNLTHVEQLQEIMKRGASQIPSWKITPTEYFKAMDIFYRLTQGSTFTAMFAAMAEAGADEEIDELPVEDPIVESPAS